MKMEYCYIVVDLIVLPSRDMDLEPFTKKGGYVVVDNSIIIE